MQHRPFGPAAIPLPIIGQGTWRIADAKRNTAVAALRRGIDLGMTHIDTAEMYEGAEAVVAEAIAGRRAEIFLVSKVLPSNASRAGTLAACDRSLQRLKTDHLDVYLLHWPGRFKLEDTIAAFEKLVEQGKIRAWGLSNFDVAGLQQAERIAGPGRIACNQVLYHLQERDIEHAVLPWCAERAISIVAYSPFGSGDFPAGTSPGGKTLQQIADANGATPRQVALAFLTRHKQVFAIPKAADENHAADNAGAGSFELSPADIAGLEAAFPRGREKRHLPMI
jgi:diketogulonate reductase-like aldo/keto reductase